jgi:hypothetical protein
VEEKPPPLPFAFATAAAGRCGGRSQREKQTRGKRRREKKYEKKDCQMVYDKNCMYYQCHRILSYIVI